jgi:hypothetical protein
MTFPALPRVHKRNSIQGFILITRFASLCVASVLLLAAPLHAQEGPAFTVGDIRVEGLQRVTEGTVYNYLPINIGDTLSAQRIREAVRALYDTGFFRDVELRRDGNTLIVVVNERRPAQVTAQRGSRAGQDLRSLGARGRQIIPPGPVRCARQIRG